MSDLTPLTPQEIYQKSLAESQTGELEPETRIEYFLNKIATSGGGSGGDERVEILELDEDNKLNKSLNDIVDIIDGGKTIVFLYTRGDYPANLALTYMSLQAGYLYASVEGYQRTSNGGSTLQSFSAYPTTADEKPLTFIVPD